MHVHSEIVRTIARNCEAFGVSETEVYRRAGMMPEAVSQPDQLVDWTVGIRVWESALALTQYRYISLNFGKNITFSVLGWIAPVTSSARNLREAWRSFADFFPLMGDMFAYRVEELPNQAVVVYFEPALAWWEVSPITASLAVEHAMSLTLSLSGYLCGKQIEPLLASFKQEVPDLDKPLFRSQFGNVRFGQSANRLMFDVATASLPVVSANPMLHDNMRSLCLEKMRQAEERSGIASKVLRLIAGKESYYAPRLEDVAAMLCISPRTLQRKLKEEGHTFQNLVEAHQIELASQLLRRSDVQVQEVAFQLGFTSLQSFSRAFKRKTGQTPSQIQKIPITI